MQFLSRSREVELFRKSNCSFHQLDIVFAHLQPPYCSAWEISTADVHTLRCGSNGRRMPRLGRLFDSLFLVGIMRKPFGIGLRLILSPMLLSRALFDALASMETICHRQTPFGSSSTDVSCGIRKGFFRFVEQFSLCNAIAGELRRIGAKHESFKSQSARCPRSSFGRRTGKIWT